MCSFLYQEDKFISLMGIFVWIHPIQSRITTVSIACDVYHLIFHLYEKAFFYSHGMSDACCIQLDLFPFSSFSPLLTATLKNATSTSISFFVIPQIVMNRPLNPSIVLIDQWCYLLSAPSMIY